MLWKNAYILNQVHCHSPVLQEDDSTAADQETTETTETAENTAAEDTTSGDEAVELHWLISVRVMWKLRYGSR